MRASLLHHVHQLADDDLPAYLYDLPELREHARAIRATLPQRVELLYATKANSDPRLLQALAEHVNGFEVASGGEIRHIRGLFPDGPIAFGGPGKTPAELTQALDSRRGTPAHRKRTRAAHPDDHAARP